MLSRFPNFGHGTIGCRKWWFMVVSETLSESGLKAKVNSGNERLHEKIFQHLYDAFSTDEFWTLERHTFDVLENLTKNQQKLAVISNTDERLDNILKSLRIRQYFNVIINSYRYGVSKPQRGIFDLTLSLACHENRGGLVPQQAVHIGDSLELDFQGARTSGWHALLFDQEDKKSLKVEEKFLLRSLLEIPLKLSTL
ncbi:haloacid dehalogenase hydrolase domain-containing protein 3-like [Tropilaelaps mercedesae]|uniref:Haloacid dehalogenase hydrolase domain-containing protein 3-like n=1 Tax=Tropilaelaps mercedesae TaxID=418985 RepID=A0A1V9XYX0_9ACAR|nr:haloacid dehalogenase hydrolase domain-containing protein 3-like [Tropilaelaps mercedesae]